MDAVCYNINLLNPLTNVDDRKWVRPIDTTISLFALWCLTCKGAVYLSPLPLASSIVVLSCANQVTDRKVSKLFGALVGVVQGAAIGYCVGQALSLFTCGLLIFFASKLHMIENRDEFNRKLKGIIGKSIILRYLIPRVGLGFLPRVILGITEGLACLGYGLTGWKNGLNFSMKIDMPDDANRDLYDLVSQFNVRPGNPFYIAKVSLLQFLGSQFPLSRGHSIIRMMNQEFFQYKIKYPTVVEIGGAELLSDWTRFIDELRNSAPVDELGGQPELDRSLLVLSCDEIRKLLDLRVRGEHTEVERHEFAMTQICKYFKSLDSEKRRERMITFASNLHNCPKGKRFAVWQYYILLRKENQVADIGLVEEESKVNGIKEEDRPDIESFLAQLNDDSSGYLSLQQEVYAFIDRELSTVSTMMQMLTDYNGNHGQLVHDRLFVRNSLYGQLDFDFEFDRHVGVVNPALRGKTREEMADIILLGVDKFVRDTVSKRINSAVNQRGNSMYAKVSALIGASPDHWTYNDENETPTDLTLTEEALTRLLVRIGFLRE